MLLVIMGKTASGKDTLVNKLVSDYGFKKIVTYTTRPMRNGEIQDGTYHFVAKDYFEEKINQGFFAEYKVYHTIDGDWYYGTAKEDLIESGDKSLIILTPDGIRDIMAAGIKPVVIYLYANNTTIRERLKKRGDSKEESERRITKDNADFKSADMLSDRIIYNNSGTTMEQVIDKLFTFLDKRGE